MRALPPTTAHPRTAPWKSTRRESGPLAFREGMEMVTFTIAMTHDWKGKHLALIGNGYAQRRSLCGYSVVPHPDGEASMIEWDARCCPQCADIAHELNHRRIG